MCDFLLVRYSNLGHNLHSVGHIAGICASDPLLFNPNFGGVPFAPDRLCRGRCIFEVFQLCEKHT